MAGERNTLRNPDLAVALVQSGGIAGLEMKATLRLSDLPPADAARARDLVQRMLAEAPPSGRAQGAATYDACDYELTVSEVGAPERRIVARDGSLTAAQRELIGLLRPRLTPMRP